jgi:4-alpha-glucanotransferase
MRFIRELRSSIRAEDPQAVLLGEVWEDASNKVAYGKLRNYCLGDTLDTVMNYPLRTVLIRFLTGQGDAAEVVRLVRSQQENYPVPFLYSLMNLMGSHDRARTLNMLVGQDYTHLPLRQRANQVMAPQVKALAVERLKKMLQIIIALPGMPSLYYGDEAGMEGAADPYNRGTYPWGREDKDLLHFVREAFALRRARPVLRLGTLEIANEGADTLLIYRGATPDGKDAFGNPLADQPYLLRLTRDAVSL